MKRFAIIISVVAMALFCFGCASNEPTSSSSQSVNTESSSKESESSGAFDASDMNTDLHGIKTKVNKPPIPCTKKMTIGNISIMVPEDWKTQDSILGKLVINSDDGVSGTFQLDESGMNANNTDEELMGFVDATIEIVEANGSTVDKNLKVERKGNLGYVIVPIIGSHGHGDGEEQEYWGYSFCGYDNELIIADLTYSKDDKKMLETFRWILDNIEVN